MEVSAANIHHVVISFTGTVLVVDDIMFTMAHADILLLHTTTITNSVQMALNQLGYIYDIVNTADWENQPLNSYDTVILAMDGGTPDANDVQSVVDYCRTGGKLVLLGGSNWATMYDGLMPMIHHTDQRGWVISGAPQHIRRNFANPLGDNLPVSTSYNTNGAGYYCLRVDDFYAHVAAENGDGWPSLLRKEYGNGEFFMFTSSASQTYWSDPADFQILRNVVSNIMSHQAPMNVFTILRNPPIVIPSGGGVFQRRDYIYNLEPNPYTYDAWRAVITPAGNLYGPIALFNNLNLPAFGNLITVQNQGIPAWAPAGNYVFLAKVGDYPYSVDEFHFPFTKLGPGPAAWVPGDMSDWNADSFFGESLESASVAVPDQYTMEAAYPNPFNPATTISVGLPKAANLSVTVYNALGQQVATLANGRVAEGYHSFTFDARNLSSGIYFIQATIPGHLNQMQKVSLLK